MDFQGPCVEIIMEQKDIPRSNSSSSLYVTSTIMNPDLDELILSVSTMLHCQMVRDEDASEARQKKFPFFQEEKYTRKRPTQTPDADSIYAFLKEVFQVGEFHAECAVIVLVYINRLIGLVDMPFTASNWKPVTTIALLLAQKVWDDNPLANADFSILYPALNVKQINRLEVKFLRLLQYKLTVTASLYARYYFELRSICDTEWGGQRRLLTLEKAKRVELRGNTKERNSRKHISKSEEDTVKLDHYPTIVS